MQYEWSEDKEILNIRKHGISFDTAKTVWSDPAALEFYDDEHSDTEERFIIIGKTPRGKTLFVIFCEKLEGEVIRIISARRATTSEKEQYERQL